ncbi:uncharacterized protein PHALS_07748 [Plasmopara halstedii]|uniref:Uncharacterized protein n=1 Tax=Plasmopara halstedii TaxID=4781 RepID=A0A0P1B7R7_PLAHL|nr:uncharacterized protein PHALS_07748 [Plasmopara halstedii]CEG50018.1 hypothetical protein PHALS_07748 [Plasmopara halstedii]|eukprot:XP_024586387.1 hypothetical protein PHALS_07748 [Plasmopara halstedii]
MACAASLIMKSDKLAVTSEEIPPTRKCSQSLYSFVKNCMEGHETIGTGTDEAAGTPAKKLAVHGSDAIAQLAIAFLETVTSQEDVMVRQINDRLTRHLAVTGS